MEPQLPKRFRRQSGTFRRSGAPDRLFREIDARNNVVMENTYDANGRVTQQKLADGAVYRMSYTLLNPTVPATSPVLQTVVTDPRGNLTTYRFSPQGYLTDITDAGGQTRIFDRQPGTNFITAIRGRTTAGDVFYTYDGSGNVLSVTDALGRTTTYIYDPAFNRVASITDALGQRTTFAYDARGNLVSRTDANSHVTRYTYDWVGLLTEVADPLNSKTLLAYDPLGNLASVTDPLANKSSFQYDGVSRVAATKDSLGRTTSSVYDQLDRVTRQVDAKGAVTQFTYDALGNLTSLTDARGKRTSFAYDPRNRLQSRTTPLSKTDNRVYDGNGNLIQFTDRRGQIGAFTYDALDRLATETYQDSTVNRFYDQAGRLVGVSDTAGGDFQFKYDLIGGLLASVGPYGTVLYTRDSLDRVQTRQVVGDPVATYVYDPTGNLASAAMPQASASFTYDERDLPKAISRMNGVGTNYAFDPAGRLLFIVHSRGATQIAALNYTNDIADRRVSQATTIGQSLITQAAVAAYNDGNQILTRAASAFTHDDNGNLASESSPSGSATYVWDARNRLKSIALPGGQDIQFTYDFSGNLLRQIDSGPMNRVRTFVLDDLTNVAQVNQDPVLTARSLDAHIAIAVGGGVEYGLADAINSTVATVDQVGSTAQRFTYEPFGESLAVQAAVSFPFQFTGRVPVMNGLYYNRARYYSPVVSRFISEDPIEFEGGLNLYAYTGNEPLCATDPSGLQPGPPPWAEKIVCKFSIAAKACCSVKFGTPCYAECSKTCPVEDDEQLWEACILKCQLNYGLCVGKLVLK